MNSSFLTGGPASIAAKSGRTCDSGSKYRVFSSCNSRSPQSQQGATTSE